MLRLFDMLFPPREDEATLRGISDDDFLSLIAPRLVGMTRPGTVVLLPFKNTGVRGAIHEAKYHGSSRAFKLLALALTEYLSGADDVGHRIRVVPIPLGKERRKERGFNQIEVVIQKALRTLGEEGKAFILEPDLLSRTRETVSQVSLARDAREENMRGAFIASRKLRGTGGTAAHVLDPAYTYIVIDDVLTTGATLQSAIDALRVAGATHIIPLALAH